MWRRVDLVLTDVLEERIASIIRLEEKRENPLTSTSSRWVLARGFACLFFYPEVGGDTFLRNVG
jgi:hypothetical protein